MLHPLGELLQNYCCFHLHARILGLAFLNHILTCYRVRKVYLWSRVMHVLAFLSGSLEHMTVQALWSSVTRVLGHCDSFYCLSFAFTTLFPLPRISSLASCPICQLLQENKHHPSCSLDGAGAGLKSLSPRPWLVSSCCLCLWSAGVSSFSGDRLLLAC